MSGMYVNVVNYGADSTGAKDSTSAIQNAINAVEASGVEQYIFRKEHTR